MNDPIRKTLAALVLALALMSSASAGIIHTGKSDDPTASGVIHTPSVAGEIPNPVTAGDMDNGVTANGAPQTGATDMDASWLAIMLSLLSRMPF